MEVQEQLLEELNEKFSDAENQLKQKDSIINSLERQLKIAENTTEELEKTPDTKTSSIRITRLSEVNEESSGSDTTPLHSTLKTATAKSAAAENFSRTRSTRSNKRQSLVVPSGTDDPEDDDQSLLRTYSLRHKSDRRHSYQPRRYLGGNTPPDRRTQPSHLKVTSFFAEAAEEPDLLEDWNALANLKVYCKLLKMLMNGVSKVT